MRMHCRREQCRRGQSFVQTSCVQPASQPERPRARVRVFRHCDGPPVSATFASLPLSPPRKTCALISPRSTPLMRAVKRTVLRVARNDAGMRTRASRGESRQLGDSPQRIPVFSRIEKISRYGEPRLPAALAR
jgi:hypothetical protein